MKAAIRGLGLRGLGTLRRLRGLDGGRRIVAFHDIADPRAFESAVAWLSDRFRIVSVEELLKSTDLDRAVALTFDDGYASWHSDAAPILAARSLPATFFVCSGYVGLAGDAANRFRAERLRMQRNLPPLSLDQLLDLSDAGFTIGSHTVNHTDLGGAPPCALLEREIGVDRARLEEWTGRPVRFFAYAYGEARHTSAAAAAYLEASGFDAAFTIQPGAVDDPAARRFCLPRHSLDLAEAPAIWDARLRGGYDVAYRLKERLTPKPRRGGETR